MIHNLRGSSSREARSPGVAATGAPGSGASAEELAGVLAEQWKAMAATVCPRFAALQQGDTGRPSARVWELVSVECLGLLCEHPEQLEAKSPGASSRLQPMCKGLFAVMKEQWELTVTTETVRLACPAAMVKWSGQSWSPSNHMAFYREFRGAWSEEEEGEGQSPTRSVRIMARRWREACQQGSQKHCEAVEGFCATEREPSDVCPHPGRASTPEPRVQ